MRISCALVIISYLSTIYDSRLRITWKCTNFGSSYDCDDDHAIMFVIIKTRLLITKSCDHAFLGYTHHFSQLSHVFISIHIGRYHVSDYYVLK